MSNIKKIVVPALALALLLPVSAGAAVSVKNNTMDDGFIKAESRTSRSFSVVANQTANISLNQTVSVNTGGNTITAKGDVTNSSIESGGAEVNVKETVEVNTLAIEYSGLDCGCAEDVTVEGNKADDGKIIAEAKDTTSETLTHNSTLSLSATENIGVTTGGNAVTSWDEDVKGASVKTGTPKVKVNRKIYGGTFYISR